MWHGRRHAGGVPLCPPLTVALARRTDRLPPGDLWPTEPKLDGWRALIFRCGAGVQIQARSGRIITDRVPDIAGAAVRQLPAGAVLDGEIVAFAGGRVDFGAVQSIALSSPARAAELVRVTPLAYAAFDLLQEPGTEADMRRRPYTERRAALLALLEGAGPPIEPVPSTTDPETALDWWRAGPAGIEGLVLKHPRSTWVGGRRAWLKIKH